ncbi:MAG TPA: universal stress protein [Acidobacteriaceae bacterium]|nr:universal stress protein [Acidobacteriaceae bacterium]
MAQSTHAGVTIEPKKVIPAFEKLLVATDFSRSSIAALSYAENLVNLYGKELLLTHVVNSGNAAHPEPNAVLAAPEIGQAMAEDLEQLTNQLRRRGIQARAILSEGSVADALEALVQQEKPSLLVTGTHGAHGLERLILGSTAEAILRKVSCPVLTVGPSCVNVTRKDIPLQTIVYATVLQHPSQAALLYAASLARELHAHVQLVHAIDEISDTPGNSFDKEVQSQSDLLIEALKGSDCKVSVHRVYGEPVEAILRRVIATKADLIVSGSERGRKLSAFMPAGVAYGLIRSAPCPVITFKREELYHRG